MQLSILPLYYSCELTFLHKKLLPLFLLLSYQHVNELFRIAFDP